MATSVRGHPGRERGGDVFNGFRAADIVAHMANSHRVRVHTDRRVENLWTRAAVVSLIERDYEFAVSLTTVGRYLKIWEMRSQKTVRRAYERNDVAIARWLRQEYPAIARQAKQEKAVIYRGDETGVSNEHVTGTSYSLLGQTPLLRSTDQRFGCNRISAITNCGHMAFMVFHDNFYSRLFMQIMQRLLNQTYSKLYLIVDGHQGHRSVLAKQFVDKSTARMRLIRMPGYCPELNSDELLSQDVKTHALGRRRPSTHSEMMTGVRSHLYRRQRQRQITHNLVLEKRVRYAP
jgi:hypothetical protein